MPCTTPCDQCAQTGLPILFTRYAAAYSASQMGMDARHRGRGVTQNMFQAELSYLDEVRRTGVQKALTYYADINEYTRLHKVHEGPMPRDPDTPKPTKKERQKQPIFAEPSLSGRRVLFDFNQNFVEMSNSGEELRSLMLMLFLLLGLIVCTPVLGLSQTLPHDPIFSSGWFFNLSIGGGMLLVVLVGLYFAWRTIFAAIFFTALCPRYRFNRTTGKVYVLRPEKFGGNAVLDWSRVQAHVRWTPPKSWMPEELAQNPEAREERLVSASMGEGSLVLYWPPFDVADAERKGEDVLWVGPTGSGEPLWQYIRTFMAQGMQAVPPPGPDNWLRKGFSDSGEHLEENVMQGSHRRDTIEGKGMTRMTALNYVANAPWAPLHSLAERLCYWPKFPVEWNSDCGRRRRERGLGPERPLHWESTP